MNCECYQRHCTSCIVVTELPHVLQPVRPALFYTTGLLVVCFPASIEANQELTVTHTYILLFIIQSKRHLVSD